MRVPKKILDKAFEIGFNYQKESYNKALISVPCCVKMKSGQQFEMAELIFIDSLHNENEYTSFQIEDVEKISNSDYSLSYKFRKASINTPEYRNNYPFFIKIKNGLILGYNAYSPVNFTYRENIKGNDVSEVIDFNNAQLSEFIFIKEHSKKSIKIICGYDMDLIEKIKTMYNIV